MPNDSYPRSYPRSAVDLFSDDEDPLLQAPPPPFSGIRLPDERTLAWAEYGNPRGVPCVLIPDLGSTGSLRTGCCMTRPFRHPSGCSLSTAPGSAPPTRSASAAARTSPPT